MHQPNTEFPQTHPCYHTANIKGMLQEIIDHLRQDENKLSEPKAQALFETSAEVLKGLYTAFDHYEKNSEPAMQEPYHGH